MPSPRSLLGVSLTLASTILLSVLPVSTNYIPLEAAFQGKKYGNVE
jgi:hypothetical protein